MLSVKWFLMFFSTAKRSFALPHAMLTRRATHESVFVHSCARMRELVSFPFHTIRYHKNVTLSSGF